VINSEKVRGIKTSGWPADDIFEDVHKKTCAKIE
jgi:hypothetical protein